MISVWLFFICFLRRILKWFLRRTTGLCELQRICYGEVGGAPRIKAVEESLQRSQNPQIKQLVNYLNDMSDNHRFIGDNAKEAIKGALTTVLLVKKINPRIHAQFVTNFSQCVEMIWGYRQLQTSIEVLRKTQYDCDNISHEHKLYELWETLMPEEPLECRITKQWQKIGFQGDDPKTDFRGMGLLGLDNLLYFSTKYRNAATHVLSHSQHPTYGYAFAIVGINLTSMAWQIIKDGAGKTYVYNMTQGLPDVSVFHQFYSYLFFEFDKYWLDCKPKNIMEFSNIKDKFEINIRTSLQDLTSLYRINLSVDII